MPQKLTISSPNINITSAIDSCTKSTLTPLIAKYNIKQMHVLLKKEAERFIVSLEMLDNSHEQYIYSSSNRDYYIALNIAVKRLVAAQLMEVEA